MAAGVIYQTVTTTSGETVELAFYVDDTVTPTTWIPVHVNTNASGSVVAFGSGANGATVPRVALATDSPGVIATGTIGDGNLSATILSVDTPANATSIAKLEDAASANGDKGIPAMAVRKATPADTSGTDGDYEMLQMSGGKLWTLAEGTAGEAHIGEVGGKSAYRVITMSVDTAAYASGDLIADTQQYDAFFRKADGTGIINTITVTEKDAQGSAYYIIFHRTSTSMGTENSAPTITDANLVAGIQHIVAVTASDFVSVSGTKIATLKNLGLPVMAVSGTDDLYISILNSTGTPTYASGEIQLGIGVLLD